jgi:diguanylate cyclase (GGDEF)-like protein/PAS domain S-box-containing protein
VGIRSPNAKSLQQAITLEILRQLCKSIPSSIAASTFLALMVGFTHIDIIATPMIAVWLALVIGINGVRLLWLKQDLADIAQAPQRDVSLHRMRKAVLWGGLSWGLASILLFSPQSMVHQMVLAFALAGLVAGGSIAYAIDIRCALSMILPALILFMLRLLIEGDFIHLVMALSILVYIAFSVFAIRRINGYLVENISLRFQADEHEAQNQIIQAQLSKAVEQFKSLTELSSDWYWEQDENFRFVEFAGKSDYNAGLRNVLMMGKTRWDLGALNMTEADWAAHRAVLEAHETFHELELHRQDAMGRDLWSAISGRPIFDAKGKFCGYRGVGRMITEGKKAKAENERLSLYDTLTGLPNRQHLINRLSQAVASCSRNHELGALVFIDLDNFKQINDSQGHQQGDQLLQEVARRLPACLRESDTVARIGGDEFVVLLENLGSNTLASAHQAELIGEKLLAHLNKPYLLGGQLHTCTPSIGMTMIGVSDTETALELMQRADTAMYQAKDAGRNTVRFYDPDLQTALRHRSGMVQEMRQGIENGNFVLYYQPQVDSERHVTGVEALIRWNHPQRGMISPGEFIPLAEGTDLILPLGNWVLETACRQLVTWAGHPTTQALTIAVNVSARQLRQQNFTDQVLAIVKATGANPQRLKLEITESLLLDNVEDTIIKMTRLKWLGIGFSLDDFGTGYSSLSYLKRLPLDQLKIDQSFVRDVLIDPNDATIAKTILSLGHSLGLAVIAEGVETQEQLEFLDSHGCKAYQGYLFARPTPIKDLKLT